MGRNAQLAHSQGCDLGLEQVDEVLGGRVRPRCGLVDQQASILGAEVVGVDLSAGDMRERIALEVLTFVNQRPRQFVLRRPLVRSAEIQDRLEQIAVAFDEQAVVLVLALELLLAVRGS